MVTAVRLLTAIHVMSKQKVVCMATGVPVTFDFHHHRFCDGGLTEEQAFKAAIATWPKGVRPQVTPLSLFVSSAPRSRCALTTSLHLAQLVMQTMCKEDVTGPSQHGS